MKVFFDHIERSGGGRLGRGDAAASATLGKLLALAPEGLRHGYRTGPVGFAQTVRAVAGPEGPQLRVEGRNLRYAAIAALGLACLGQDDQRSILGGITAADLALETAEQAGGRDDPGTLAVAAWAAAEVAQHYEKGLFARLRQLLETGTPLPVVDVSWMLTAAVMAARLDDTSTVAASASDRLLEAQGALGVFPHVSRPAAGARVRTAIGSFADQIYPVQALSRMSLASGDERCLEAAERTARRICDLQGPSGQWWWHYDSRTGQVLERYPVYSVHQHAMAPMALFDLRSAGGADHSAAVAKGLSWLDHHPEVIEEMVSERHSLVWRKVGRREPRKAARALNAATAAVSANLRAPGLDLAFPPVKVDHECRPYELGWLLYAWLPHEAAVPGTGAGSHAALLRPGGSGRSRNRLFGLEFDALTLEQVVDMCESAIDARSPLTVGVVNAAKAVNLRSNDLLCDSLLNCDVLLADGQAIVWSSRILGRPLPERVAGIDLFQALLERGAEKDRSVYLLGARQDVLDRLIQEIRRRWPRLRIVGHRDGYFSDDEAPQVAEAIAASGADMLFLGMTSPKKELFLAKYGPSLGVPVLHGVGGSFDVLAGITRRAPLGWQRLGMEWAYRLAQEPRRLGRRYLVTNSAFVGLVLRERLHPTPPYFRPSELS